MGVRRSVRCVSRPRACLHFGSLSCCLVGRTAAGEEKTNRQNIFFEAFYGFLATGERPEDKDQGVLVYIYFVR